MPDPAPPAPAAGTPEPCPFCGGPGCHGASFGGDNPHAYAGCTGCRIFAKAEIAPDPYVQLAVAKWNRRVAPSDAIGRAARAIEAEAESRSAEAEAVEKAGRFRRADSLRNEVAGLEWAARIAREHKGGGDGDEG